MAKHIEVETRELQEQIREAHERGEGDWVRYVGLSTALLAVFAAVAALQSGSLVNEALIHQIKASDTWAQYQASRQKDHVYTIAFNAIVDAHANDAGFVRALRTSRDAPVTATSTAKPPVRRALDYRSKIADEAAKETKASAAARRYEANAAEELQRHYRFEYAVALIQVAIALGAVAALSRLRMGWYASMAVGGVGIVLFTLGFLGR